MVPALPVSGLPQEEVVPTGFPWTSVSTARWIRSRSPCVSVMFDSQVGPNISCAWVGLPTRLASTKAIGIIRLYTAALHVMRGSHPMLRSPSILGTLIVVNEAREKSLRLSIVELVKPPILVPTFNFGERGRARRRKFLRS